MNLITNNLLSQKIGRLSMIATSFLLSTNKLPSAMGHTSARHSQIPAPVRDLPPALLSEPSERSDIAESLTISIDGARIGGGIAWLTGLVTGEEVLISLSGSLGLTATSAEHANSLLTEVLEQEGLDAQREKARKVSKTWTQDLSGLASVEKQVEKLSIKVANVEVALVDVDRAEFRVSMEDFANYPQKSIEKLESLSKALEENSLRMERLVTFLVKTEANSQIASKSLQILSISYVQVIQHGGGVFGDFFAMAAFEADELAIQCGSIGSDCKSLLNEIAVNLPEERRRAEVLRKNLETIKNDK